MPTRCGGAKNRPPSRSSRAGSKLPVFLKKPESICACGRAEYRATGIAVTADLTRIAGDDVLMVYDQYVGADIPTDADLEALVRSIETRLSAALNIVTPPEGALPVVFTPAGLAAV